MTGRKVTAALWRARKKTGGFMYFDHEPTHLADSEPLVLQSDLAAAIARAEAIRRAYQAAFLRQGHGDDLLASLERDVDAALANQEQRS